MTKTKKSTSKKKAKQVPLELDVNRREEWRFDLPLAAVIEGKLPSGDKFAEETLLENISSGGAYFCLDTGVVVGSKLNIVIDLPSKLTEGKKTRLKLGGITVRLEKSDEKTKHQGVAVRFAKDFKFIASRKKKK